MALSWGLDDRICAATKTNPDKLQMDMVPREYWENHPINADQCLTKKAVALLRGAGFEDVEEDLIFD